jgi:hypothetical protein
VVGFVGQQDNPAGFLLLDPIYGELYWPTAKLEANWAALNNMAVVVHKPLSQEAVVQPRGQLR